MAYSETKVFMIGYDMTLDLSLENITQIPMDELDKIPDFGKQEWFQEKSPEDGGWMVELAHGNHDTFHIILVGTKYDLWLEQTQGGKDIPEGCTSWEDGYKVARAIGAKKFICTSSMTGYGVTPDCKLW